MTDNITALFTALFPNMKKCILTYPIEDLIMKRFGPLISLLMLAVAFVPVPSFAEDVPLWEAGAGITVLNFPQYRGSDQRKTYVLPIPYFVYHGKILKVDGDRIRGLFFKSDRVELDMSLGGSIPVDSSHNVAREGMPDLDPSLEFGPAINIRLAGSAHEKISLQLRLPVRAAIDINADYLGLVFQPRLNLDIHNLGGNSGWNLGLATGPIFADQRFHEHFYSVAPEFATPDRPAYYADGGYGGFQFVSSLSKRYPKVWVGGFIKLDTLAGAVFRDSPLVKNEQNFTAGIAVSWIFARSKRLAKSEE